MDVVESLNALGHVLAGADVPTLIGMAVAGRITGRHETSTPRVDGFGSHGFLAQYRDFQESPNQVRHFVGAMIAGAVLGPDKGLARMNANEMDPGGTGAADVQLNQVAVPLGADLQETIMKYGRFQTQFSRDRMHQLADETERKICDPRVD